MDPKQSAHGLCPPLQTPDLFSNTRALLPPLVHVTSSYPQDIDSHTSRRSTMLRPLDECAQTLQPTALSRRASNESSNYSLPQRLAPLRRIDQDCEESPRPSLFQRIMSLGSSSEGSNLSLPALEGRRGDRNHVLDGFTPLYSGTSERPPQNFSQRPAAEQTQEAGTPVSEERSMSASRTRYGGPPIEGWQTRQDDQMPYWGKEIYGGQKNYREHAGSRYMSSNGEAQGITMGGRQRYDDRGSTEKEEQIPFAHLGEGRLANKFANATPEMLTSAVQNQRESPAFRSNAADHIGDSHATGIKKPELKLPPRARRRYADAASSKFCHICQKSNKGSMHIVCSNIEHGLCRKAICRSCVGAYMKLDIDEVSSANSGFLCPHCLGTCPPRSQCVTYSRTNMRRRAGQLKQRGSRKASRTELPGPLDY